VTNTIENGLVMWRAKRSRGPDVEMIVPLLVTVAVESKNTPGDALRDFSQVISYKGSEKYDAVMLRIEEPIEMEDERVKPLLGLARMCGIGVIAGGDRYSPLVGSEKVLLEALLHLTSDPAEVLRRMGWAAQILSMPPDRLLIFRKYLRAGDREQRCQGP